LTAFDIIEKSVVAQRILYS